MISTLIQNHGRLKQTETLSKLKSIRRLITQSVILCFSFFIPTAITAQSVYADSLTKALQHTPVSKHRIFLLNELAWELKFESPDSARSLLQKSLRDTEKLKDLKGKSDALNYRGVVEDIQGNTALAMTYFEKSLIIRKELGDVKGQTSLYNNLGNGYESLENYSEAIKNYRLAHRMRKELGDEKGALRALYNISIIHENLGNYKEALDYVLQFIEGQGATGDTLELANAYNLVGNIMTERDRFDDAELYYRKAEKLHRTAGNKWELAGALQNLGNISDARGEYLLKRDSLNGVAAYFQEAISYYEKSLQMTQQLKDKEGQAELYNNIGATQKNIGTYYIKKKLIKKANAAWEKGLSNCEKSLALYQEKADKKGLQRVYNTFGDIYRRKKNYKKALYYSELSLEAAKQIKDKKYEHNAYKDIALVYYEIGKYKEAYHFRKKYDELRYQVNDEAQVKSDERRLALYSDHMKEYEIESKEREVELLEKRSALERIRRNTAIGGVIGFALLAFLLFNRNRLKNKSNKELIKKNEIIEAEKKHSESLLLNILPAATAAELKQKGKADARHYENVTILFTDFVSFTKLAEQYSPEELVAELDTCFKAFDAITTRHNIEKIKTIGDAYMCAGGLPIVNERHALDIINTALEMLAFIKEHQEKQRQMGKPIFKMRIGIHTGEVVTGVVGHKKFAYDIWGDAVNIAAHMESSSKAGKINISRQTYEEIKDHFTCTYRGKVKAKNKGEIEMYFVEDKK